MKLQDQTSPGSSFTLEQATWRDLSALRNLEKICFPKDAWPLIDLIGILSIPRVIRIKAVIDGEMVGFVAGDTQRDDRLGWIATIGVQPEYRGQGIGSALLLACEKDLNKPYVRLCVRAENEDAIRLYVRHGYSQVGRWNKYYRDGADAVVMEKEI